jgi:hypothetical protein
MEGMWVAAVTKNKGPLTAYGGTTELKRKKKKKGGEKKSFLAHLLVMRPGPRIITYLERRRLGRE